MSSRISSTVSAMLQEVDRFHELLMHRTQQLATAQEEIHLLDAALLRSLSARRLAATDGDSEQQVRDDE